MLGVVKILFGLVLVLMSSSCRSFSSVNHEKVELRLLETANDLCLFEEVGGVDHVRYLLFSNECEWRARKRSEFILVDAGVDLRLVEFKAAFAYLDGY